MDTPVLAKEGFRYFAFISYSRRDSRAAAFLHKKLEKFRIPVKRVPEEMRKGLGKFAKPVFRDKRDLEVGESSFTEDVKNALKESRYIIVLCSPNSAQSIWVDSEVRYFLATHGNDLGKVVPVIFAGSPDSGDAQTECLCECLRSDEAKPAIVQRNLPTMIPDEGEPEKAGWEAGIVGALSYMLKVKRMDIKATIDAERIRYLRINTIVCVVFAIVFAMLALWAINAERIATQNRMLAEKNEKRAIESEQLAKRNEMRAAEQEQIAIEQRDRAIVSERQTREKNEQLEYIRFLQENFSSIKRYKEIERPHFCSTFASSNNMPSIVSEPNSTIKYVRLFVKENLEIIKPKIAGSSIVDLMLEAMGNDLLARKNHKSDAKVLLCMQQIFLGNQINIIEQEIKTNTTITVERKSRLYELRYAIRNKLEELKKIENQLDKEILEISNLLEQCGAGIESDEEFDRRIDKLLQTRDYAAAINTVRTSTQNGIRTSTALWKIISNLPVDEGMDEMKMFYSLLERNDQYVKALKDNQYLLFVAQWDLRIAELLGDTENFKETVKYIEDAVSIMAKQDVFKNGLAIETPRFGDIYSGIDTSLLAQYLETYETNKASVARNFSNLYDVQVIQCVLSRYSVLMPERPYYTWYIYGRKEELLCVYEFHERLCEFVSKNQGEEATISIRNVLHELKSEFDKHEEKLSLKRKIAENENEIAAGKEKAREKFAPKITDDPGILWGKVLRFLSLDMRDDALLCVDVLRRKQSPDFPLDACTASEVFIRSRGRIPFAAGVMVTGIEPPATEHAIYKIGDIITAMDGRTVASFNDYRGTARSSYTVYRCIDGALKPITLTMPENQPRVALVNLMESPE